LATLAHPAEVHAVALAGGADGGLMRLLTGCADGHVRLWTLTERGGVAGPSVWAVGHEGPVRALALSADGALCATGGEDRRVGVWEIATGRHLYWLQAEGEPESV